MIFYFISRRSVHLLTSVIHRHHLSVLTHLGGDFASLRVFRKLEDAFSCLFLFSIFIFVVPILPVTRLSCPTCLSFLPPFGLFPSGNSAIATQVCFLSLQVIFTKCPSSTLLLPPTMPQNLSIIVILPLPHPTTPSSTDLVAILVAFHLHHPNLPLLHLASQSHLSLNSSVCPFLCLALWPVYRLTHWLSYPH